MGIASLKRAILRIAIGHELVSLRYRVLGGAWGQIPPVELTRVCFFKVRFADGAVLITLTNACGSEATSKEP